MPTPSIRIRKDSNRADGLQSLYLQLYLQRKKLWIALGIHVRSDQFDLIKERVRNHAQDEDLNLLIGQALGKATDILIRFRLKKEAPTRESFLRAWANPDGEEDFIAYAEQQMFLDYQRGRIKPATLAYHQRNIGVLRDFVKEQGWTELPFNLIGPTLMAQLDLYVRTEQERAGNDGQAARWNSQKVVKKYLNTARSAGKEFTWPYPAGSKVRYHASERVHLSEAEVKQLEALLRSNNPLITQARRIALRSFLVQCFCGLRFGDLSQLTEKHLVGEYIEIVPEKTRTTTGAKLRIPVSAPLHRLLADPCVSDDRSRSMKLRKQQHLPLVPVLSEPATNRELKRCAKMARVDKHLTTHVGRHTFATLFLSRGGRVEVLQRLLGHSSINTTMVYVHLTDQRAKDQVEGAFADW